MASEFQNVHITQAQFTALADLANSKLSPSVPFAFTDAGGWKTELQRIRTSLFSVLKYGSGYQHEAFCSGPWPFGVGAPYQITRSVIKSTGVVNTATERQERGLVPQFNDVSIYYPEIEGASVGVSMNMNDIASSMIVFDNVNETGTFNTEIAKLRIRFLPGTSGRLTGTLSCQSVSFPNISNLIVDGPMILATRRTVGGVEIDIDGNTASGILEWTFRRQAGAPPITDLFLKPGIPLSWLGSFSVPEEADGIHGTKRVFRIDMPDMSDFGAFHPDGDLVLIRTTPSGGKIFMRGNQAVISFTPSAELLNATEGNRAIWTAKTLPICGINNFDNPLPKLAPNAKLPSVENTDLGITAVSTTRTYALGTYHFDSLETVPQVAIPNARKITLGSFIRDLSIVRGEESTVDSSTGINRHVFPLEELTVRIGCIRNGEFVEFETFILGEEVVEYRTPAFWPILSHDKLIYDCSGHTLAIHASIVTPMQGTIETAIAGTSLSICPTINFPLLGSHYGDTITLLGLL